MHHTYDWVYSYCFLCILVMFDWLTMHWLMENLGWIITCLLISLSLLFFFPILLGLQLKDETHKENKDSFKKNS